MKTRSKRILIALLVSLFVITGSVFATKALTAHSTANSAGIISVISNVFNRQASCLDNLITAIGLTLTGVAVFHTAALHAEKRAAESE